MTEYDLFVSNIPMIAEMVARCRMLDQQEYEDFKCEIMESVIETVKEFVSKIFIVIDKYI